MTLTEKLDWLIDQWCERRELRPLQCLLRAYPGVLAHTDQFGEVLDALRDVKGLCREKLKAEEVTMVISLINELEDFIKLRLGS
ncbi:MAG TPA: hypothetical protein VFR76_08940 [Verrucomicrobiae bacterium]|nr:hypothetical protein [Verrucomicrobiae bacterium]